MKMAGVNVLDEYVEDQALLKKYMAAFAPEVESLNVLPEIVGWAVEYPPSPSYT